MDITIITALSPSAHARLPTSARRPPRGTTALQGHRIKKGKLRFI